MHIPQLTFTRFLAAISVVILHFGLFSWPFNTPFLFPIACKATSAVSYFFILSGFILVVASLKNNELPHSISTRRFWINRSARIIPVYLFSIALYFALHFNYNPQIPLEWQIQSYLYTVFFMQSWNYNMALDVNYPAWSLSVEAFFYFIFPWLYLLLNKINSKILGLSIFILWVSNSYLFYLLINKSNISHNFIQYFPLLHLVTFIIGMGAGFLFIRHYDLLSKRNKMILYLTASLLIFLIYASYLDMKFFNYQNNGLLAPFFILVIYYLGTSKNWFINLLSSKPFVFLGDISYSIYLLQVPVIEVCIKLIPYFQNKEQKDFFFSFLIILILSSIVIHLTIENPLRKWIRKSLT